MKMEIIGDDIAAPVDQAQRLFRDLGLPDLQVAPPSADALTRVEPFTVAAGIVGLILMLPPAIDATINLIDRGRRDTARKGVEDLKAALEAAGAEGVITTSNGRTLILPKVATDDVVDAILTEIRERQVNGDPK